MVKFFLKRKTFVNKKLHMTMALEELDGQSVYNKVEEN